MPGFLNIYLSPDDTQDFLKSGYYENPALAMNLSLVNFLLPFPFTPKFDTALGLTVTTFNLNRIDAKTRTVVSTTSLSTAAITKITGAGYDYFYYDGGTDFGTIASGTYEYEIILSDGTILKSEYFCHTSGVVGGGDFNNDFNNDFYIY